MKTSEELLVLSDLAGWRIAEGYWAQLAHGLMGTFPALFLENKESEGEMFVCLDKRVLEKALTHLSPRGFRISKSFVVVSEASAVAFDLQAFINQHDRGDHSKPVRLLRSGDLVGKDKTHFKWAPGLVSNNMSREEFLETMQSALARA